MGTENYTLIAADVRDTEDLTKKLGHIDKNLPTLVLTECLLVYMKSQDSNKVLKWVSDTFADVALLNYEMVNPYDQFGKMMIENIE